MKQIICIVSALVIAVCVGLGFGILLASMEPEPEPNPIPWKLVDTTEGNNGKDVVQKVYFNTETQIFCVMTFNYDTNRYVYASEGIYMDNVTTKFYDMNGKEVTHVLDSEEIH